MGETNEVPWERSDPARWRGWEKLFWMGLACWVAGFLWHWTRPPSMWILDALIVPVAACVYGIGFWSVIVAAVGARRRAALLTLVPAIVVLTLLVNSSWRLAPQTWFAVHRPLFDLALKTEPGQQLYGNRLPVPLRFLTVTGRVSDQQGGRFFPQWLGIPDDAGGYLYNPGRSPEGVDLYGKQCRNPVDLGAGWWMCGMAGMGSS
ncbi:hypothetical protein [Mycolicibacterium sp.]|uniref:hypothetical protein n=1 Tax=Mycolicibacterium sp. TaxID=2320850 RepID=UPI001A338C33|nr:hypothetical protein [Mycolicibacterium sp.]MBJ7341779.1 hypothetical protein [Mycolicibacterium sp.]